VTLVVVSDGHLHGALDRLAAMVDAVPGAIVQVREKQLDGRTLYELVRSIVAIVRPRGGRVLVNDRVDVALAAGADGVHLPETGLPIADARALAPGLLIGASRHSVEGAVAAAGADLVMLGPIWDTPGKGPALGVAALTAARAALPASTALIAVGGIDSAARADAARAAGADHVAAIRAHWSASDPAAAARARAAA
jgi:thiamine-phosphate pyrophosphorylase